MRKFAAILLTALVMSGCLIEDRLACRPPLPDEKRNLHVRVSYTFEGEDLAGLMGGLRVFVFDSEGLLVKDIGVSAADIAGGKFDAGLPEGDYTLVAWGVDGGDLHGAGYLTNARVGETRLENFKLHLADPAAFGELYYAIAENVSVPEEGDVEVPLAFIRHTNLLRVTIKGLHRLVRSYEPPLEVFVTGKKGTYGHDGQVHSEATPHTYPSSNHAEQDNSLTMDVRILRLQMGYHEENPLLLHVERNGAPFMEPLDVMDALLQTPYYNTQEDLDRIYEHPIEIEIDQKDLSVTITIKDFEIIRVKPGDIEPLFPVKR
jgi:hypothetical protein